MKYVDNLYHNRPSDSWTRSFWLRSSPYLQMQIRAFHSSRAL